MAAEVVHTQHAGAIVGAICSQTPNHTQPAGLSRQMLVAGYRSWLEWGGNYSPTISQPQMQCTSDAYGSRGCGAWHNSHWFQLKWAQHTATWSIAAKELLLILLLQPLGERAGKVHWCCSSATTRQLWRCYRASTAVIWSWCTCYAACSLWKQTTNFNPWPSMCRGAWTWQPMQFHVIKCPLFCSCQQPTPTPCRCHPGWWIS